MKRTKLSKIAAVAADQWGMISTAQATAVGADAKTLARLANSGELERLAYGIYRLAGSPPGPHDDLRAAWIGLDPRRTAAERIAAGPVEVVSHRSAAVIHELGDLEVDLLEFTASVRRQTRREDVRIHRGKIDVDDWVLVDGLPVTTPLRTIQDLAAARIDRGHLAGVVRDAMMLRSLPVRHVAAVLAPQARAYGVTAGDGNGLVGLLLNESGIPQSALDMALHAGPEAQRLLADRLMRSGAFNEVARNHLDVLASSGLFEAFTRMHRTAATDLGIEEAVRAAIGKTFADLAASLDPTVDARTAIQQWLAGLLPGLEPAERQQIEPPPEPPESATSQMPKNADDER